MEIRHTIRILDIPRNEAQLAAILRTRGMSVYDDLRGIPPSDLTWQDNINGAGARTFIWNDRQRNEVEQYNNVRHFSSQHQVPTQSSFEDDIPDSRPLVRLQQMYES